MKKLFLVGVIVTLLVTSASAQRTGDRIQRQRVERGFDNGQLTRPEKFRLERDRTHIRIERHRALRDGRINHAERRRLHKMRRHERRETIRFRHNGRRRLQ